MSQMREVYGLLLAGKKLKMHFESEAEANTFRIMLFRYKKSQDDALLAVDMMSEEERQLLSFKRIDGTDYWRVEFRDRANNKALNFSIIEESDDGE